MGRVIVVGSINQDITVTVDRFPQPGETLSGTSTTYGLGGKGANQAAAAAHGGATTLLVGRVGGDAAGITLRLPPLRFCTDNGAQIAALGSAAVRAGVEPSPMGFAPDSGMPLDITVAS